MFFSSFRIATSTFAATFARKKLLYCSVFLLLFARLFVPLTSVESTFARKSKRKTRFPFAFCSLIRTFAAQKRIFLE